jgi:hypothetical protein
MTGFVGRLYYNYSSHIELRHDNEYLTVFLLGLGLVSSLQAAAAQYDWPISVRERETYFTTGGLRPISSSWRQALWDSRPDLFLQLNTCGYSLYVTSSLMRGWLCCLKLLLVLASAVILRSESHGTHDVLLWSHLCESIECPFMTRCVPQTEYHVLHFLCYSVYPLQR